MVIKDLKFSDIKELGEKLRKYLLEQYNKIPDDRRFYKKGDASRNTHIRVLYGMLPDWAVEIAELSFKDPNKEIDWDPEFLLSLEFSKPIL
ncbi:MAG: hypothetical protein Athens071416_458 [Parcubacteria group bacterium Athens0714_16]|nr:MAG: hypothetical protein Athens071416_458 [Parcubacteria group bacterium Athens0714_16]